jgi:uncharacterized protein
LIDDEILREAERYGRAFFQGDASGHDWYHMVRVRNMAQRIAREEGADQGVVALAALLHDMDDAKLSPETSDDLGNARAFLYSQGVSESDAQAVLVAIREVSFSKNGNAQPSTREAACVRDADRLDAIGAIGVARAFAFGGVHGRALHDPEGKDAAATTQHFHDKLFKLADSMCTDAGARMAQARDAVTRSFLEEFEREWEGER